MNIKSFKPVYPKVDLITSPKSFFASIKYQYLEYRNSGVYNIGQEEGLFIYKIIAGEFSHLGILTMTEVSDLAKGKILKHEGTLAAKEQQMMHLIMQRKALVKPVLLAYKKNKEIAAILESISQKDKPIVDVKFESGDERHLIWPIYDQQTISRIKTLFSKIKCSYIGDGHHRTTTVALLSASKDLGPDAEKYNDLFTAYFQVDQLKISDFNRVVDISEIMSASRFMAKLSKYFKIKEIKPEAKPKNKHEISLLLDRQWYQLKWRKKYIEPKVHNGPVLDADLINEHIFKEILNIADVRTDTRIKYYSGTDPMYKLIRQTLKVKTGVGLCIYPVRIEELTALADQGETLPPKSTFFLPRLRSGILAKDL